MKKEDIVKGAIRLITEIAEQKGYQVENQGLGHGFDNGVWKDIAVDDSNIPSVSSIIPTEYGYYRIQLRPFWDKPEIDVHRDTKLGEELLIFNYSDSVKNYATGRYDHTGDWYIDEVRVNSCSGKYKALISEVYSLIDRLEELASKGE